MKNAPLARSLSSAPEIRDEAVVAAQMRLFGPGTAMFSSSSLLAKVVMTFSFFE
jgi:hypothetical protein